MPSAVDRDAKRAAIVEAVWGLIAEHGFEGVTFRRVAAAASVSVGQVQHHFADRDDLIVEGCRRILALAEGGFAAAQHEASAGETLWALLVREIPTSPVARAGLVIWNAYRARSLTDPHIAGLVVDAEAGRHALAVSLAAELGVSDAEGAARRLLALADGLALHVLVGSVAADEARALLVGSVAAEGMRAP